MVEQAKSLDYEVRKARFKSKVSDNILSEVMVLHEAIFQDD